MLARGNYGVEWTVNPTDREPRSSVGIVVLVVVCAAIVSLAWTLISHYRSKEEDEFERPAADNSSVVEKTEDQKTPLQVEPPPKPMTRRTEAERPANVRNLLMRLEEAQRLRDAEMEVSTIEQIRALPGTPAADLDDVLARRLGRLNMLRLFEKRNGLWVKKVEVRSGQSASRIASENGSTLASFAKLNGGKVDTVFVGRKMYVMDHPRFILVVHRRLGTADLQLNGKFFKRYDCKSQVLVAEGAYEWGEVGGKLDIKDVSELQMMLPKSSSVVVSEM